MLLLQQNDNYKLTRITITITRPTMHPLNYFYCYVYIYIYIYHFADTFSDEINGKNQWSFFFLGCVNYVLDFQASELFVNLYTEEKTRSFKLESRNDSSHSDLERNSQKASLFTNSWSRCVHDCKKKIPQI